MAGSSRGLVLVIRAWVEEGRPDGFRARLIQTGSAQVATAPHAQIVTTSLEETLDLVRAWLMAMSTEAGPPAPPRDGAVTSRG